MISMPQTASYMRLAQADDFEFDVFVPTLSGPALRRARELEDAVRVAVQALQDASERKGDWARMLVGGVGAAITAYAAFAMAWRAQPEFGHAVPVKESVQLGESLMEFSAGCVPLIASLNSAPDVEQLGVDIRIAAENYIAHVAAMGDADRLEYLDDAIIEAPWLCLSALACQLPAPLMARHAEALVRQIILAELDTFRLLALNAMVPLVFDLNVQRECVGWTLDTCAAGQYSRFGVLLLTGVAGAQMGWPDGERFMRAHLATMDPLAVETLALGNFSDIFEALLNP